jgi:hypothetical protein
MLEWGRYVNKSILEQRAMELKTDMCNILRSEWGLLVTVECYSVPQMGNNLSF